MNFAHGLSTAGRFPVRRKRPNRPAVDNPTPRFITLFSNSTVQGSEATSYDTKEFTLTIHEPSASLSIVDRVIETMELGNIAFNVPDSMNLEDTDVIRLILGLAKTTEELTRELAQAIEAEGRKEGTHIEGAHIRVSNRMEARLSGSQFQITAITPEVQAVSSRDETEWKWEIKPTKTGRHYLHLTLTALFTVDNTSTSRAIRTFDKTIEVEVILGQRALMFLLQYWQWLWTVIFLPFAPWLWKKIKKCLKEK